MSPVSVARQLLHCERSNLPWNVVCLSGLSQILDQLSRQPVLEGGRRDLRADLVGHVSRRDNRRKARDLTSYPDFIKNLGRTPVSPSD